MIKTAAIAAKAVWPATKRLLSNAAKSALGVFTVIRRLAAASELREIQFLFFAILAAMVGILFTVRANYVASFRAYDMEAVGHLIRSETMSPADSSERLLACINLLASGDSRNAESIFTLVTVMFAASAVILAFQAVVFLMKSDSAASGASARLIFPWILPHLTTLIAGFSAVVAVLIISGFFDRRPNHSTTDTR